MLLHTHAVENDVDHYFLHLNAEEAQMLIDGLTLTLEQNPESQSYSVNLGPAVQEEPQPIIEVTYPENGNGSGLIVPGQ